MTKPSSCMSFLESALEEFCSHWSVLFEADSDGSVPTALIADFREKFNVFERFWPHDLNCVQSELRGKLLDVLLSQQELSQDYHVKLESKLQIEYTDFRASYPVSDAAIPEMVVRSKWMRENFYRVRKSLDSQFVSYTQTQSCSATCPIAFVPDVSSASIAEELQFVLLMLLLRTLFNTQMLFA